MPSSSISRLAAALLAAACAAVALPQSAAASTDVPAPAIGECAPDGAGTVATDKDKYFNFETVQITGGGYAPGCEVLVEVERPDGSIVTGDGSGAQGGDRVVTAADGTLSTTYQLADIDGLYHVRVVDATTGVVLATTSFYDNPEVRGLYEGGSATGPTSTSFDPGDQIYADGLVDGNRHYRWIVSNASGIVWSTGCSSRTASGRPTAVGATYTLSADARAGSWDFELRQYASNDTECVGSGNYTHYANDWITFNVAGAQQPAAQTISFAALADRSYGAADATLSATATSGLPVSFAVAGDSTGCTVTGATLAVTGVGTCKVTASQAGSSSWSAAPSVTREFAITAKSVTGSFTAGNKVYDGTASATITGRDVAGVVAGDEVTLTGGSASFADASVGADKDVTGSGFALGGADRANYALGSVAATTAAITAKSVTGSFTAADKVYDGTASATITGRDVAGVVAGDEVTLTGGSASFVDANVGADKDVTGSGFALAGADRTNYALGSVAATTADITALGVTGSFTAADKVEDGTRAATITARSLSGKLEGDDVALTGGSALFDTAAVGDGKTVTGTGFALSGATAANYILTDVGTATARITARSVTPTQNDTTESDSNGNGNGNGNSTTTTPETGTVASSPAPSPQFARATVPSKTPVSLSKLRMSASCVTSAQLGLGKLTGGMEPLSLSYALSGPAKVYVTIARRNPSMARKGCGTVKTVRKSATYDDLAQGELDGQAGENTRRVGAARAAAAPLARMSVQRQSGSGTTTIQVTPLLKKRTLRPGTYRVLAYAQDADGTRTPLAKAIFRVVG